jgi:hypothetical protein
LLVLTHPHTHTQGTRVVSTYPTQHPTHTHTPSMVMDKLTHTPPPAHYSLCRSWQQTDFFLEQCFGLSVLQILANIYILVLRYVYMVKQVWSLRLRPFVIGELTKNKDARAKVEAFCEELAKYE